jgi:DNA-binding MarR family transcriptional regulator
MTETPSDILFVLHIVARALRLETDRRARSSGMTRAQWVILFWLDRQPGLSQAELADLVEVEPITVGRLVDRLEARGMVERRPDPKDRRIWRLHLLPEARPVLRRMAQDRAEILEQITAGLDPGTVAAARDVLLHMKSALSIDRSAARAETKEIA